MHSNVQRAGCAQSTSRPDLVERRLRRYDQRFQERVRALAGRHRRLAELAVSFPALLFALAAPRRGIDVARGIARAIAGASLAQVAAIARIPLWLRWLPPEAFARPIPELPDGQMLRRRIANHLPGATKRAPVWLQAVADAAQWGHEPLAVWIARELTRASADLDLARLPLIALFAWFSGRPGTRGHDLIDRPWSPTLRFGTAAEQASQWGMRIALELNLGTAPIVDMWLRPGSVDGYDFVPLRSAAEIAEEAVIMRNCLRSYGYKLAHNRSRIWSVRRDGERVAALAVGHLGDDPLPDIVQLLGPQNDDAPREVWWAARRWVHGHDLMQVDTKRLRWGTAPLDRASWIAIWRPYWLAKQRIPAWLPLRPSRAALGAL
jgi:hypothetical protein